MGLDESALTLSQRAYVNLNSLRNASKWLFIIVSAILLFNLLAIVACKISKPSEILSYAMIMTSFLLSLYVILWYIVKVLMRIKGSANGKKITLRTHMF